jgi:hypothetical protein
MKTSLKRLILLAAALPLFVTLAQAQDWFVGSGVPVQYNSPADFEAATGRTLTYGEAPTLAALVDRRQIA